MMKTTNKRDIVVIGATGTVGCVAYNVLKANLAMFNIKCLVAENNYKELYQQGVHLGAESLVITNAKYSDELKKLSHNVKIKIFSAEESVIAILDELSPGTMVLIASSGTNTIKYLMCCIKKGHKIALANKESIVCMGGLLKTQLLASDSIIIPVDSEHNAIFQLLASNNINSVAKLLVTGSGGVFWQKSKKQLCHVTKKQALAHPVWNMGSKILIDSATGVNKALELIEASFLFDIDINNIELLIHREALIHGGVLYRDGSLVLHAALPSMEVPIGFALNYPKRLATKSKKIDFLDLVSIELLHIDSNMKEVVNLAKAVYTQGGNSPCIFNTANELAVEAFLQDRIAFHKILDVIKFSLDTILWIDVCNSVELLDEYAKIRATISAYLEKKRI